MYSFRRLFFIFLSLNVVLISCSSNRAFQKKEGMGLDPDGFNYFKKNPRKNIRVGVATFNGYKSGLYDMAVTDEVISAIAGYNNVHLIERSRLDSILKEQKLNSSGLVSQSDAVKIGEILPLDLLVAGNYSLDGDTINANGRFIDVVSGEIVETFDFALYLKSKKDKTSPERISKEECVQYENRVNEAMRDLKTQAQINHAVDMALRVPFQGECRDIHYHVMHVFRNTGHYPPRYKEFIINILEQNIDVHPGSNLYVDSFNYLSSEIPVKEDTWNIVKTFVKEGRISTAGFVIDARKFPVELNRNRVDELMDLAKDGEIGRPHAMDAGIVAVKLVNLKSAFPRESEVSFALDIIEKYGDLAAKTDEGRLGMIKQLTSLYVYTSSRESQKRVIDKMIYFFKNKEYHTYTAGSRRDEKYKTDLKYYDLLWNFIRSADYNLNHARKGSVRSVGKKGGG